MALKLKRLDEKKSIKDSIKGNENKVKLNLAEISSKKSLQQIAQYEIISMLDRLKFLATEHNLVPIIKSIDLTFVPSTDEGRTSEGGTRDMEAFNGKVSEDLEH